MKGRHVSSRVLLYIGLALLTIWTLLPVYWMVNMSLMFKVETLAKPHAHFYPQTPTVTNYTRMFGPAMVGEELVPRIGQAPQVLRGLLNNLIVAASVAALTMAVAIPVGYAMGRLQFRGKLPLLFTIISTRSYPPMSVIIPFFVIFQALKLQYTLRGLILIDLTLTIPLVIWILMGFFEGLPMRAEAQARVDGLTRWQAIWRIIVPMGMPGIAACFVIAFLLAWNEFNYSLMLTPGSDAQTFPPTLAMMFFQISWPNENAAAAVMGLVPPAILAVIFQRGIRRLNIVDPLA